MGSSYNCGYYYMTFTPNPSVSETTLTLEPGSEDIMVDESQEWDLEIYDQNQMLKEKKIKLKGKACKIKTAGWKSGVYFVRASYGKETIFGKLQVK